MVLPWALMHFRWAPDLATCSRLCRLLRALGKQWDTQLTPFCCFSKFFYSCSAGMPGNTIALHLGQRWCALWSEGVDMEGGGVWRTTWLPFFFFLREKQLYNLVLVHIKCRETTSCCPPCSCAYRLQLSFIFSHSNQTASHKVYSWVFPH